MGEQQLPLLLIDHLPLLVLDPEGHIFQRQALHFSAEVLLCLQGDQGWNGRDHSMAQGPGHLISVAGRAGGRI